MLDLRIYVSTSLRHVRLPFTWNQNRIWLHHVNTSTRAAKSTMDSVHYYIKSEGFMSSFHTSFLAMSKTHVFYMYSCMCFTFFHMSFNVEIVGGKDGRGVAIKQECTRTISLKWPKHCPSNDRVVKKLFKANRQSPYNNLLECVTWLRFGQEIHA